MQYSGKDSEGDEADNEEYERQDVGVTMDQLGKDLEFMTMEE